MPAIEGMRTAIVTRLAWVISEAKPTINAV
jgi:hypothetical protein